MPASVTHRSQSSPVISPTATAACGPPSAQFDSPRDDTQILEPNRYCQQKLRNNEYKSQDTNHFSNYNTRKNLDTMYNSNNNNLTEVSQPSQQNNQKLKYSHQTKTSNQHIGFVRNKAFGEIRNPTKNNRSRTDTVYPASTDIICNNNYLDNSTVQENTSDGSTHWIYSPCYMPHSTESISNKSKSVNNNLATSLHSSPKRRRNVFNPKNDDNNDIYAYKIQRSKNAKIVSINKQGVISKENVKDEKNIYTENDIITSKSNQWDADDTLTVLDINANNSPRHAINKSHYTSLEDKSIINEPQSIKEATPRCTVKKTELNSTCYRSDRYFRPIESPDTSIPSVGHLDISVNISNNNYSNESVPDKQPSKYSSLSSLNSSHTSHIRSPTNRRFLSAETHHRSRRFYRKFLSLNKFWQGTKKQNRSSGHDGFVLHMNPIPDPESDFDFDIDYDIADSEMLTSFNNPNYELNDADALNSNLPASQYYSSSTVYSSHELITDNSSTTTTTTTIANSTTINNTTTTPSTNINETPTNGTANSNNKNRKSDKRRKKYAHMDLNDALGITSSGEQSQSSSIEDISCSGSSTPVVQSPTDESERQIDSGLVTPAGAIIELQHISSEDNDEQSDQVKEEEHSDKSDDGAIGNSGSKSMGGFLGFYASLERSVASKQNRPGDQDGRQEEVLTNSVKEVQSTSQRQEVKPTDINSPDSNDSGIQADTQTDRYGASAPKPQPPIPEAGQEGPKLSESNRVPSHFSINQNSSANTSGAAGVEQVEEQLPPGWQKCTDDDGESTYYWHIKSGSIQRDPPKLSSLDSSHCLQRSLSSSSQASNRSSVDGSRLGNVSNGSDSDGQHDHLSDFQGHALKFATASLKSMAVNDISTNGGSSTHSSPGLSRAGITRDSDKDKGPVRFAVRSLGWVRIAEEDLTPERSSRAVNKCIVDLSLGRNDINDVVGRWGDGKDLYMDLDHDNLSLIDPQDLTCLHTQSIQSIRVWGVGRDNGRERDFAYVARDRCSRRHMCHVFRCDTPARHIANQLRDICKQIMLERTLKQRQQQKAESKPAASRPSDLPNLEINIEQKIKMHSSFPTPMEEPKKILRCHYLGTSQVSKPTGIEVLNGAIEKVYSRVPPEKWVFVSMAVAPSTITIAEHSNKENILAECRMRFLSFMGIAMRNIKLFGFIVHSAQNEFIAHVFHCEPSVGAICKTIQAACMLRYQKCLDSHHSVMSPNSQQQEQQPSRSQLPGLTASLKAGVQNVLGKFRRKSDSSNSLGSIKNTQSCNAPEQEALLETHD